MAQTWAVTGLEASRLIRARHPEVISWGSRLDMCYLVSQLETLAEPDPLRGVGLSLFCLQHFR